MYSLQLFDLFRKLVRFAKKRYEVRSKHRHSFMYLKVQIHLL